MRAEDRARRREVAAHLVRGDTVRSREVVPRTLCIDRLSVASTSMTSMRHSMLAKSNAASCAAAADAAFFSSTVSPFFLSPPSPAAPSLLALSPPPGPYCSASLAISLSFIVRSALLAAEAAEAAAVSAVTRVETERAVAESESAVACGRPAAESDERYSSAPCT